ncbi:MAG: SDR family oxidoreductase [Bacteroidota bacterium]
MNASFQKNIVITGVSTGIGEGCARIFAARGYRVFGSLRKASDAQTLQQELGDQFVPLIFDVTDPEGLAKAVETVNEAVSGRGIDGLINNAGIAVSGPLLHISRERMQQQLAVNVMGVLAVTQAFAPLLGARANHPMAPGRILNVSSVGGKIAMPFTGAYAASKFGLEGMTHALRRELALYGIKVVIIAPGAVKTAIWNKTALAGKFEETDYVPAIEKFEALAEQEKSNALTSEQLGGKMLRIFEKPRPRTRYLLASNGALLKVLTYLVPENILDKIVQKQFGLKS